MTRTCRPSSSELLRSIAGAKVVKEVDVVVDVDTYFEHPIRELESCVDAILRIFRRALLRHR
jgi:adenylate cyclase class IV